MSLPDKFVEETILIIFDFTKTVAAMGVADVTLTAPTFTLKAVSDPTRTLNIVSQQVQGLKQLVFASVGEGGFNYDLRCSATFSNGERRTLQDFLKVV
jgi:hypothetical protein